jgi:hypothetical protein
MIDSAEIYVALLDEGADVWRPVPAHRIDDDTYVILRPDDYDPDDETWQFPPGTLVTCQPRATRDGTIVAAIGQVVVPRRASA